MVYGELITLPDGTQAMLIRSLTWGEGVIILLLTALLFLALYREWREHK
jgi:hypothetical protein